MKAEQWPESKHLDFEEEETAWGGAVGGTFTRAG